MSCTCRLRSSFSPVLRMFEVLFYELEAILLWRQTESNATMDGNTLNPSNICVNGHLSPPDQCWGIVVELVVETRMKHRSCGSCWNVQQRVVVLPLTSHLLFPHDFILYVFVIWMMQTGHRKNIKKIHKKIFCTLCSAVPNRYNASKARFITFELGNSDNSLTVCKVIETHQKRNKQETHTFKRNAFFTSSSSLHVSAFTRNRSNIQRSPKWTCVFVELHEYAYQSGLPYIFPNVHDITPPKPKDVFVFDVTFRHLLWSQQR